MEKRKKYTLILFFYNLLFSNSIFRIVGKTFLRNSAFFSILYCHTHKIYTSHALGLLFRHNNSCATILSIHKNISLDYLHDRFFLLLHLQVHTDN